MIIEAMRVHAGSEGVCLNACYVLHKMCLRSKERKQAIIDAGGLSIIKQAERKHIGTDVSTYAEMIFKLIKKYDYSEKRKRDEKESAKKRPKIDN